MRYARFYGWPFNNESERLAADFYAKAIAGMSAFKRPEDFALCLCSNENGSFVFVYLENNEPFDGSIEIGKDIGAYCEERGCPAPADIEHVGTPLPLNAATIPQALKNLKVTLHQGAMRQGGRVVPVRAAPSRATPDPRKEPCHCGSGRRFENCHGFVAELPPAGTAGAHADAAPEQGPLPPASRGPGRWWQAWRRNDASKPWVLRCAGCRREYVIGVNCFVATDDDVRSMAGRASVSGRAPSGPDLIGRSSGYEAPPATLSAAQLADHRRESGRIIDSLESGVVRSWACNSCGHRANAYPATPRWA